MASSEEDRVIATHSVDEWKRHYENAINSNNLVVVDFIASWCGPCRFISPIFAEIAKKTPNVVFLKVDVDELGAVAEQFKIDSMPTFVFLQKGAEVHRIVGSDKDELQAKILEYSAIGAEPVADSQYVCKL